jgi:choline dehydrogenase-like flavoprotein
VVVSDGRATGIRVRHQGSTQVVTAQAVVLAAGTVENSRLALQALASVAPDAPDHLPGLADHIVQGFFVRFDGAAARSVRRALPPGSYYAPSPPELRSNLFVDVTELPGDGLLLDLRLSGEQLPSAESRVRVTPSGSGAWPVTVEIRLTEGDEALVLAQRGTCREIWESLAELAGTPAVPMEFDPFHEPRRTNAVLLSEALQAPCGVPVTWSSPLGTEDHEGGTLGLGTVLDERHEFRDVPGLYAVGPSTFPRLGAANPGLTTLALARRMAAYLVAGEPAPPISRW